MLNKKSVSNTAIISIIALVVIIIIFLLLVFGFSKNVKKTDESSSVNTCKLKGTNNYCCEPYSGDEIPQKEGGWKDCEKPKSACCVG